MNQDEVAGEEGSKNEKEMKRGGQELGDKSSQRDDGDAERQEKGLTVAVMEEMAMLEISRAGLDVERLRVQKTIGRIECPDHEEHSDQAGGREVEGAGGGDERGPMRRDRGGVE